MANGKNNNGANGYRPVFLALYFLGAVLSGAGGNYLWLRNAGPEVVRPDPYTGTQAKALERRLTYHLENHPDIENRFDARLTALEAQYALIISNQARIMDRIDRLNGTR